MTKELRNEVLEHLVQCKSCYKEAEDLENDEAYEFFDEELNDELLKQIAEYDLGYDLQELEEVAS